MRIASVERKRYPQYEHCAVIIAEDITARFLNVISLFNGTIPLIAIQVSAWKIGDQIALIFSTVMNDLQRGLVDEDEEVAEATNRAYWEVRATKATISVADSALELIHHFAPTIQLKYNKFYIGLEQDDRPNNFVIFRAKKTFMKVEPRISESDELRKELEEAGLDLMEYDNRWGRYRIRLKPEEINGHKEILERVLKKAYLEAGGG